MRDKITYLPTAAVLVLSVWAFFQAFSPSGNPQIFIFSYFRFSFVVAIGLIAIYLAASFRFPRLISFNNWSIHTIVGAAIVVEIGLRAMPTILPMPLVQFLPSDARKMITHERGLMSEETLTGEGLLYFFKPHVTLAGKPWVRIDSKGYRNRTEVKDAVDVVFLGDSVTMAQNARKDFADLFREWELTAFNLAQGGYGAYQYRDAYKKFVIEPGLEHRYLVLVVTGTNDFEDTLNYVRTLAKGGDYRDYFGRGASIAFGNIQSSYFPWVIAILGNAMPIIKDTITGRRSATGDGIVRLPYGDLPATSNILRTDPIKESGPIWRHFKKAMNEILVMALDRGVKVLVAYHPPPRVVYGPLLDGHEDLKKTLEKNHRNLMAMLASFLDRPGVRFTDLTAFEQTAAARENIGVVPMDVHLNTRGVELVAGELFDELQQMND